MTALLFFLLGIVTALLYYGHLYWQLKQLAKRNRPAFFFSFQVRFAMLGLWFGALFWVDATMAVFSIAGMVAGRFGVQYAVYAKKRL
jgi:hypothetical protein